MKSKFLNKLLAIATSSALLVTSFATFPTITSEAASSPGTVTPRVSVHDPSIIKTNGTYYVFGSHLADAKSTNLMKWTQMHTDYGWNRNWKTNSIYGNILTNLAESFKWAGYNDGDCSNGGLSVWAPDIYYNKDYVWSDGSKGAYMAYYSASSTWRRSCIGYGVSKTVEGPYEYVDTIIYSGFTKTGEVDGNSTRNTKWDNDYLHLKELINNGSISGISDKWFDSNGGWNANYAPNAIDPTLFDGADGKLYMVYGSWSGGLFILELDPATGAAKYPGTDSTDSVSGNFVDRYFGTHIAGGNHQSGEGPFILYDEETKYYYLYETYGGLLADGGYNMRLFRSKNPYGPYLDAAGRNAKDSGRNNNNYGIKLIGNYQFTGQQGYKAAGHNSALIDDDGQRYLFYHQRFTNKGEGHELRVHQQFLNEDNWPITAVYEYRGETISHYDAKDVVGTYEIIDHGTSSDGTMLATQTIQLCADGKITGDMSGTWTKTTGSDKSYDYITLKVGTLTYKGILYKQFNEANTEVMTFSVIGNNNTSVWGTQTSSSTEIEASTALSTLIYGFDFETAATNGKLSPIAKSSKTNQAELVGTASIVADAKRGNVLQIQNAEGAIGANYLRLPTDTLSTVTGEGYTVSMWVNVGTDTWEHSALFEANGGGQDVYPVTRMGVNLISRINAHVYSDGVATDYTRNAWHHVAYSVNTTGIRTYLDGVLVDSTSTALSDCFNATYTDSIHKATNVRIGSGNIWGDEDIRNAKIDDVRIYGSTLTADDVKAVYTGKDIAPNTTEKPNNTGKKSQNISVKTTINKTYGAKAFKLNAKLSVGDGALNYSSNNKKVVSVNSNGKVTIKGTGKATITIKASETANYLGVSKKVTIKIAPKKIKLSSVKSKAKKKATVKWKKAKKATGYEIQYSTKKNFKSAKKITIKKVKTTKTTIKKLKSKKTYYFRVRPYKKSSGSKVYGAYSKVKKAKIK